MPIPKTIVIRSTSGRNDRGCLITLEIGSLDPVASKAMGRAHDDLRRLIVNALEGILNPEEGEVASFNVDFTPTKSLGVDYDIDGIA